MGSGLIWAGLGKGISDAGTAIGSSVMADMREKNALERAKVLEDLRAEKQSALEDVREEKRIAREEREKKNRMDQATEASKLADEAGRKREENRKVGDAEAARKEEEQVSSAVSKVMASNASAPVQKNSKGQVIPAAPAASEAELRELIKKNPQAYDLYEKAGLINKSMMRTPESEQKRMDPRLQRTQDEYDAAVGIGAHSTVLESFDKKRQRVMEEIRLENADKKEANRTAEQIRRDELARDRDERLGQQFSVMSGIAQQNANANTSRANKPAGEGGGNKQERLTTIINSQNAIIKSLDEGSRGKTPEEKAAWTAQRDAAVAIRDKAQKQLNTALDDRESVDKSGDKGKSKSVISELPKGAVQIGTSNGKPVYQTPDGKKFIGK